MAEAMIGEIRAFPYMFTPVSWLQCCGQKLDIRQYPALYATIGAIYGGDGATYFNLPDLQGHVTLSAGQAPGLSYYMIGKEKGTEGVALTDQSQIPSHTHTLVVENLPLGQEPSDFTTAPKPGVSYGSRYWYNLTQRPAVSYVPYNPVPPASGSAMPVSPVMMAPGSLDPFGGTAQPHENRQPYLPVQFCICYDGYFMPNPG